MVNFPIFQKKSHQMSQVSEYLQMKHLNCVIFEENPEYSGSSYQLTVYLVFCLANIPIFRNLLHQIQIITPKQSDFTNFSE